MRNGISAKKHKYFATGAPTVNDDVSLGFHPLSQWVDKGSGDIYVCIDATEGTASWLSIKTGALVGAPPPLPAPAEFLVVTLSDTSTSLNVGVGVDVPLSGFSASGAISGLSVEGNTLVASEDMVLDAESTLFCTGTVQRSNVALQWRVNGAGVGPVGANHYIRAVSGHNESSPQVRAILPLSSGDVVTLRAFQLGAAGTVSMDAAYPSILQLVRL